MAYNIGGLHNKKLFLNFFNFLNNFDIFFLLETFVTLEKVNAFESYFSNFSMHWIPAKKQERGRPVEGFLYGIKIGSQVHRNSEFLNVNGKTIVKLKFSSENYFIIPVYINDSKWEDQFSSMYNFLSEFDEDNIMLIGDFNARMGTEQVVDIGTSNKHISEVRKSKDSKLNKRGLELLDFLNSFGFILLNGRTKGDEAGEYTFISGQGCSTIDLCAIRGKWVPIVSEFSTLAENYTNHLPVSVIVRVKETLSTYKKLNLLPKIAWNEKFKDNYKDKMREQVGKITWDEANINIYSEQLKKCVKDSTETGFNRPKIKFEKKQKWFDWQCFRSRDKSYRLLSLYRKTGSDETKIQYLETNKRYKELCQEKKSSYLNTLAKDLINARDSAAFWGAVRVLKGQVPIMGSSIRCEDLASHFSILLNPLNSSPAISWCERYVENVLLDGPITMGELKTVLTKGKNNKAPGVDRIAYEFYKHAPDCFLEGLVKLFSYILSNGEVPESFKKSVLYPLYKKGDPEDPNNYRAISFNDSMTKILTSILLNRLITFVKDNDLISEFQAGFRSGYGTTDHIFTLTSIIQLRKIRKKKTYALFIDFKSAFDHIDRNALFFKLSQMGVTFKFLNVIRNLYENTTSFMWDGQVISDEFLITVGLKQGCILSPIFFILFIEDLIQILPGGVQIGNILIKLLLYADDIIFLAETPESLQFMINRLAEYCKKWNLIINLEKSKVVVFKSKRGRLSKSEKWFYNRQQIEVVNEYRYLGIIFNTTCNMTTHLQNKYNMAVKALNTTWNEFMKNKNICHSTKYKIFESVMRAIMCYGGQVWGYLQYDTVEKLQRFFIKRLFRLPSYTPNYMIHVETGLAPLYIYTFKLHIDYIVKVMQCDPNRLPYKIGKLILQKRELYIKEWESLAELHEYPLVLRDDNVDTWRAQLDVLLKKVDEGIFKTYLHKAQNSLHRNVYINLNHMLGNKKYFSDNMSLIQISSIFKIRGELLNLNYIPHKDVASTICSLCNKDSTEDSMHFLAECPILQEIRYSSFNKPFLTVEEAIAILDGTDWMKLAEFVRIAMNYRNRILSESF